ncbi:MAG: hypothetical protein AB4372_01505 [Xenococcus sp. (in: cyanobacteria)]
MKDTITALMPIAFLVSGLLIVLACVFRPELVENPIMQTSIGGAFTGAASLSRQSN